MNRERRNSLSLSYVLFTLLKMVQRLYYSLSRKDISVDNVKSILEEYASLLGDVQGADARAAKQNQIKALVEKLLAKKPAEEKDAVDEKK